ncbi:hypothetical protein KCU91_g140, partial [Aureobasidium melanogenum]
LNSARELSRVVQVQSQSLHGPSKTRVVVRLPTPAAGPAGRNVNSEVATIKYCRFNRQNLPLFRSNKTIRRQQKHCWPSLSDSGTRFWYSSASYLAKSRKGPEDQMSQISCSTTGKELGTLLPGIRFTSVTTSALDLSANLSSRTSPRNLRVFPMAAHVWLNMTEFANGLIRLGLSNVANKNDFWTSNRCWQGTPKEHANLLNHARRVLRILAKDPRVVSISTPTMLPCLTLDHTFVKPGEPETITCMTGWRACPISPAFLFSLNHTVSVPNRYLTSEKTEAHVGLLAYFDDVLRANISFHRRYIPHLVLLTLIRPIMDSFTNYSGSVCPAHVRSSLPQAKTSRYTSYARNSLLIGRLEERKSTSTQMIGMMFWKGSKRSACPAVARPTKCCPDACHIADLFDSRHSELLALMERNVACALVFFRFHFPCTLESNSKIFSSVCTNFAIDQIRSSDLGKWHSRTKRGFPTRERD